MTPMTPGAPSFVRPLGSLLRATAIGCACALVLGVPTAGAFEREGRFGHDRGFAVQGDRSNERAMRRAERAQRWQQQREGPPTERNFERPVDRRDRALPQQPDVPQYRPPDPVPQGPGRPGRLTPDERRALRQQINEAGRDVYRPGRN
jgi:hypothetical protein